MHHIKYASTVCGISDMPKSIFTATLSFYIPQKYYFNGSFIYLRPSLFWDVTQLMFVVVYRRFRAAYRSHSQGCLLGLLDSWRWDRGAILKIDKSYQHTLRNINENLNYAAVKFWNLALYRISFRNELPLSLFGVKISGSSGVASVWFPPPPPPHTLRAHVSSNCSKI